MPSRNNPRLVGPCTWCGVRRAGAPVFLVVVFLAASGVLLSSRSVAAGPEKQASAPPTTKKLAPPAAEKTAVDKPSAGAAPAGAMGGATGGKTNATKSTAPSAAGQLPAVAPAPPLPAAVKQVQPPDQTWLLDVPEKSGVRSRGKAAVFLIQGDDYYQPVRAAVVKTVPSTAWRNAAARSSGSTVLTM